ncbi:MAG: DUF5704 domain-containing protein [Acetivibrionales bacterium]
MKYRKIFSIIVFFIIFFNSSSSSFAGNNDSLPSYGYSGKGDDRWKYNSNYSGMRISFYWAPDEDSFNSGEGVIQLGKTTDVSKTGPWYKVELYTGYSIYWYMNKGNAWRKRIYSSSDIEPYDWAGYGDSSEIQSIVNKMPDVWTGTKAQWDNWFEGPIDPVTNELGYENIPDIAKLCGADISVEQFKNGELDIFGYKRPAYTKSSFEPVIYPIVDGVCMAMTLRDLIRWEEAFHRNDIATSDGKDLIEWITPVFVFTSNSQFLIENEAAISMYGKNADDYTKAYSDTKFPLFQSNISKANTYKAIYDSPDINVRRAQRAAIKEQLNPGGGIIYNSMGVGVVTPYVKEEPESEPVIESEYEEPVDHAIINENAFIKADPRDNETFEVTKGIPAGEAVYTQIITDSFLYRLKTNTVSGYVTTRVTVNHLDEEGEPKTTEVNVSRPYSYIEITSFELYEIKSATVENDALPGKKAILTPKGGYLTPSFEVTHNPDDRYTYHVSRSSDKTIESDAVTVEEVNAAAQAVVSSPTVRNDKLIINGQVILDPKSGLAPNRAPGKTNRDVLYASNIVIPESTKNGTYESSGTISYERVYSYAPENSKTLTFDLENINPIVVHTPVCASISISSDDMYNQRINPSNTASALILGRPFTVDIINSGSHRNIKGYGYRDYTKYIKDREIRFTFDAYLGTDMTGTYLKANTWYSLSSLGVSNPTSRLTFYTPVWVDEGLYNVEVRSIAKNDTSKKSENRANLNPSNTAALANGTVEISGRVYDFTITDIDDISWEAFFRESADSHEHTGKVFYTGPKNINGDPDSTRKYIMPVMPGKNDVRGYQQRAVKLGYTVKFEIKTVGNYYDELDYVQIKPSFAFVDREGKNRQEVDLYYSTATNPLVRIGSPEDTEIQRIRLDFKYRGIDLSEFTNTAEAIYRLRGGMGAYTLEKWKEAFPKLSQNGVVISKYSKLLLSEPIRSFIGPDRGIPENVNKHKALASIQKWYGEYHLPADLLVVPKGTDLSKERNLTKNSPVFLKDGFVIVNFKDITVINNDDFDNPSIGYTGKTGDGWALEGYNLDQGGWQLMTGDIIAYYADRRASDDYIGTGTH